MHRRGFCCGLPAGRTDQDRPEQLKAASARNCRRARGRTGLLQMQAGRRSSCSSNPLPGDRRCSGPCQAVKAEATQPGRFRIPSGGMRQRCRPRLRAHAVATGQVFAETLEGCRQRIDGLLQPPTPVARAVPGVLRRAPVFLDGGAILEGEQMAVLGEEAQRQFQQRQPARVDMCWPINSPNLVTPVLAEVLPTSSGQVALSLGAGY